MASGPGSTFSMGRKDDVTVTRLSQMCEVAHPVSGKGKTRSWLLLGCSSPGQQLCMRLRSVCCSLTLARVLPGQGLPGQQPGPVNL